MPHSPDMQTNGEILKSAIFHNKPPEIDFKNDMHV